MGERTLDRWPVPFLALGLVVGPMLGLAGCGDADPDAEPGLAERTPEGEAVAGVPDDPPDAYAPRIEISPEAEQEAGIDAMFAREAVIPSRDAVPIPPYPGARVVQAQGESEMTLNQETFTALPVIVLVTEDPPEEVVAFYQRELPGWNQSEILLDQWFWEGDDDFHPLEPSGMVTPAVVVMARDGRPLAPQARTEIQVRYRAR